MAETNNNRDPISVRSTITIGLVLALTVALTGAVVTRVQVTQNTTDIAQAEVAVKALNEAREKLSGNVQTLTTEVGYIRRDLATLSTQTDAIAEAVGAD